MMTAEDHRRAIRAELAEPATSTAELPEPVDGETVIEMEHVYLAFDRPVLEDVSLCVRPGETLMVAGESGCWFPTAVGFSCWVRTWVT